MKKTPPEKQEKDLATEIREKQHELAKLRMMHAVEPLKNPREITRKKREIARMKTAQNQDKK